MLARLKVYLSVWSLLAIHYLHKFRLILSKPFLLTYFEALQCIKSGNKWYLYTLNSLVFLLQLKGVHFLYLYTYQDNLSKAENILHYNFVALDSFPGSVNLYSACSCLIGWKAFNVFYVHNHGLTIQLIYSVMIEENHSCLMKDKYDFGRIDTLLSRAIGYSPNENTIAVNLQWFALLLANGFYWAYLVTVAVSFKIFLGHFFLYSSEFALTTLPGVLHFVIFLWNAAMVGVFLVSLWYILFFIVYLMILVASGGFFKLNQIDAFFNGYLCKGYLPESKFTSFLKENALSLRFLADVNRIYGNVLFAYILIYTPFNAVFLMTLLLAKGITSEFRLFLVALILIQINIMLFFDLFSVKFSFKLHQPAKKLLPLPAKFQTNRWRLLSRFKLLAYMEQFHTFNLYTVNYGKFGGKINYQRSGRHLFYYFKFIMFAFKLLKK